MASQKIDKDAMAIDLRVVSTGAAYEFFYKTGEEKWELLCKGIDAGYLSTATAGGFTGTTIGLYAISNE